MWQKGIELLDTLRQNKINLNSRAQGPPPSTRQRASQTKPRKDKATIMRQSLSLITFKNLITQKTSRWHVPSQKNALQKRIGLPLATLSSPNDSPQLPRDIIRRQPRNPTIINFKLPLRPENPVKLQTMEIMNLPTNLPDLPVWQPHIGQVLCSSLLLRERTQLEGQPKSSKTIPSAHIPIDLTKPGLNLSPRQKWVEPCPWTHNPSCWHSNGWSC